MAEKDETMILGEGRRCDEVWVQTEPCLISRHVVVVLGQEEQGPQDHGGQSEHG